WQTSIAMRPPQDQGWFGVVDHLGTSARSDGWEFLTSDAPDFWGDGDRIAWRGPGVGFLEWKTPGLIEIRLVAYAAAASPPHSVRILVSPDRERWTELDVAIDVSEEVEGEEGARRRLLLTARPPKGGVQWLRIEVPPFRDVQLGHLDLGGLEASLE